CRARLSKQAGSRRSPLKFNTITVQRGLRVEPTVSDLCASDNESQIRGIADATVRFFRLRNFTVRGFAVELPQTLTQSALTYELLWGLAPCGCLETARLP